MRVIIHAGANKTGSSSIQASLAANRALLAAHGIDYPELPKNDRDSHWQLMALSGIDLREWGGFLGRRVGRKEGDPFADTVLAAVVGVLDRAAARGADVIFSFEGLGTDRTGQVIGTLQALSRERGGEVCGLIYVRPDHKLFASDLQQRLKDPEKRLRLKTGTHVARADRLATQLGPEATDIRLFDRKVLKDGDVLSDFVAWVERRTGRKMPALVPVPRQNESLSAPACAILLRLRELIEDGRIDPAIYGRTRRMLDTFGAEVGAVPLALPAGWERRLMAVSHKGWNDIVDRSENNADERAVMRLEPVDGEQEISEAETRAWLDSGWDAAFASGFAAFARRGDEVWWEAVHDAVRQLRRLDRRQARRQKLATG